MFAKVLEKLVHLSGYCFGPEVTTAVTMKSMDFRLFRRVVRKETFRLLNVSAGSSLGLHFDSQNVCSMFLRDFNASNLK
jgi:hypothetical protein